MRSRLLRVSLAPVLCVACAAPAPDAAGSKAGFPDDAALEHAISVRDGRTRERIALSAMLDDLAQADVAFLGETHTDETTHRVERAVYEAMLARRSGRVVLAMEMFERDVQPTLDAYLAGEIDEATFRARARPWSNYTTAYRPMIERARREKLPVVASNYPSKLRNRESITPDERALVPVELLANTPEYWRRVDNAIRGHAAMMGPAPATPEARLTSTQSLWDNSMGEACALALDRHPDHMVLHVNGGFHSEYWDGTVRQLKLRDPDARVRTVAIVTSSSPTSAGLSGLPIADYVVFAEERAQDVDDGAYAVFVARELRYRLFVPPQASESARVPLVIWLHDEGESAEDALALWKTRLGDECAIAAIEAPYRETQEDLVEGGRWFWPDSFDSDVSSMRAGIERVSEYARRHYPIDPARIVLAGEGTGATIVAATALLSDELEVRALALSPRRYLRIKDFSLPLPELRGDDPPAHKSLHLLLDEQDGAWWSGEVAEYQAVGFESSFAPATGDPWRAQLERENAVRSAAGLAPRELPSDAPRAHVVAGESPRSRAWARMLAAERAKRGELVAVLDAPREESGSKAIELAVRAADYASGSALPRAPGPFGGTTVIVLPDGMPADEVAAWIALEKEDVISKHSRFHHLAVATASGERALPYVLTELAAKKRKNVLIVPAAWDADSAQLRDLRRSVRAFENQMTLQWRPGLGGAPRD